MVTSGGCPNVRCPCRALNPAFTVFRGADGERRRWKGEAEGKRIRAKKDIDQTPSLENSGSVSQTRGRIRTLDSDRMETKELLLVR